MIDTMPTGGHLALDLAGCGLDDATLALVGAEIDELAAPLGLPVRLGASASGPRWVVAPGATALSWDPASATMTSHAHTPADVMTTLNLLPSLAHSPGRVVTPQAPATVADAVGRVERECAMTCPTIPLRGVAWQRPDTVPTTWAAFAPWAMAWVARLEDAHTAVLDEQAGRHNPPYTGTLHTLGVTLLDVPPWSSAHEAGVRAGWVLAVEDPAHWLRVTGATPQSHARVAARRAIATTQPRRFEASDPTSGRTVAWEEPVRALTSDELVSVWRIDGRLHVRLRAFDIRHDAAGIFDELLRDPADELVLDLRGNVGGNLLLATGLRDRFLRERTRIGSTAFTTGRGTLGPRTDRWAEPSERTRWRGRLLVRVDASTYSAAEDFVLGLQGLAHVRVEGERTGGGSGRPRLLALGPGLSLRISTGVTYDRAGHPVEHRGIVPDA